MYKEYESKIKMIQEQELQLKMKFLLGYNMKIVIQWGARRINLWWRVGSLLRVNFFRWWGWWWWRGG